MKLDETLFRAAIETSSYGFAVMDLVGHFRTVNDSFCRMTGYSRDELMQINAFHLEAEFSQDEIAAKIKKIKLEGKARYKTRLRRKDGSLFHAEHSATHHAIENGLIFSFVCDITEHKQVEKVLLKANERLELAQIAAGSGVWDWDITTGCIEWSPELFRLFGLDSTKDLAGFESWRSILHPEDREVASERIETAIQNNAQLDSVYRIVRRDGEARWIHSLGRTIYDESRKPLRMMGICIDITKSQKEQEALKASLEFSNNLISSMQDGFSVLDKNGCVLDVNPAFCCMTGFLREELLGLSAPFPYWPLEEYENIQAAFRMRLKGEVSNFESTFMHKSGVRFPVIVSPSIVKDGHGNIVSYSATVKDISERKQAEATLQQKQVELQEAQRIAHVGSWRLDTATNHVIWSEEVYHMLGLNPELPAPDYFELQRLFIPESWERLSTALHRTQETGIPYEIELEMVKADGKHGWMLARGEALRDANDAIIGVHGVAVDITERKQAAEKIEHLAYHDQLTCLPNRLLLMDRLSQELVSSARIGRGGALLFIDLDNFKSLNDTLGHEVGDVLLQQVAQRLEFCMREGDTVARLGGDEFVVILIDLSELPIETAAQTEAIGEKILATLRQPYQLDVHAYRCTASIGVTLFNDNQQAIDELMKQADIAMYQAKKAGRNALRFFDPQMQTSITARASLENELLKALEKQQFQLYYQVQMDSSFRPFGVEALIRWIHPERGLVSPAHFIPLAEETGVILPIGRWVLEAACAQLNAWQQETLTRDLVLAVNVSSKQFRQDDFVAQVQAAVQRYTINPMLLKLELTESLLLENIEDTIATMNTLNEIGVQLSLDDFGTGYSSLQYLKRLPLDQLKIDQSFVRDIATDSSDKAIVRTIIAMAHSLNLDVIAEGVETEEQRQFLLKKGCTHFQGYLFGKPLPIGQFEALLKLD